MRSTAPLAILTVPEPDQPPASPRNAAASRETPSARVPEANRPMPATSGRTEKARKARPKPRFIVTPFASSLRNHFHCRNLPALDDGLINAIDDARQL